jgi:hypothetical protein
MNILNQVLYKVIVRPFYEQNAGLFLVLFLFLFGIVPPSQLLYYHYTIILGILAIPELMAIVLIIWSLYAIKCLGFVQKCLKSDENSFLYIINNFPRKRQFGALLFLQFLLYLPITLYGGLIIGVGFNQPYLWAIILIFSYLIFIHLLSAALYLIRLNRPDSEKRYWFSAWDKYFVKPFFLFYIYFIINQLKLIILLSKLISIFILQVFFDWLITENYDVRLPFLAILLSLITHCIVVFELHKFERVYLTFSRNFAWHLPFRFAQLIIVYTLILIPEWAILVYQMTMAKLFWADVLALFVFGLAWGLFYHCILYTLDANMDKYLRWVFGMGMVVYFIILYSLVIPATILVISYSYYLFQKYYPQFEHLEAES